MTVASSDSPITWRNWGQRWLSRSQSPSLWLHENSYALNRLSQNLVYHSLRGLNEPITDLSESGRWSLENQEGGAQQSRREESSKWNTSSATAPVQEWKCQSNSKCYWGSIHPLGHGGLAGLRRRKNVIPAPSCSLALWEKEINDIENCFAAPDCKRTLKWSPHNKHTGLIAKPSQANFFPPKFPTHCPNGH